MTISSGVTLGPLQQPARKTAVGMMADALIQDDLRINLARYKDPHPFLLFRGGDGGAIALATIY